MSVQKDKDMSDNGAGGAGLDYEIPQIDNVIDGLGQAQAQKEEVRNEHIQKAEEEEEKDKKKKKKKKKRGSAEICWCGHPYCTIGPMQRIDGGDE